MSDEIKTFAVGDTVRVMVADLHRLPLGSTGTVAALVDVEAEPDVLVLWDAGPPWRHIFTASEARACLVVVTAGEEE